MHRGYYIVSLVTLSLILCGCAASGAPLLNSLAPRDVSVDRLKGEGLVVLSCTLDVGPKSAIPETKAAKMLFSFIRTDADKLSAWSMEDRGFSVYAVPQYVVSTGAGDFGGKPVGMVHAVTLKPAQYELWRVGTSMLYAANPPKLRFTVTPGTVTYIGNVNMSLPRAMDFDVSAQDMGARDLPVILAKYPNLKAEQIQQAVMTVPATAASSK